LNERLAWQLVRGAVLGLALFALVAHGLLHAGLEVGPWWLPACLGAGLVTGTRLAVVDGPSSPPAPRWLAVAAVVVLVIVVSSLIHGSVATPARDWDGTVSWSLRARALADRPTLEQPFFREPAVFAHTREYPLLQPLCLASGFRLLGPDWGRLLFPLLYALLLALFFLTLRRRGVTKTWTWPSLLAFGLTPALIAPTSGGVDSGFADVFLTLCLTALAAGLLVDDRLLLVAAAFLMPLVKPEGVFYPLVAAAAAWLYGSRAQHAAVISGWAAGVLLWAPMYRTLLGDDPAILGVAGVVLLFAALAVGTKEWLARRQPRPAVPIAVLAGTALAGFLVLLLFRDRLAGTGGVLAAYASGIDRAIERLPKLPEIVAGYAGYLVFVRKLGLVFVLLALLAFALRKWTAPCPSRLLAALLVLGGLFLLAPILLTPEPDLRHFLRSSMARLLGHWTGAAWLLTGAWAWPVLDSALASWRSRESTSTAFASTSTSAPRSG
jgi:hypothetical protein